MTERSTSRPGHEAPDSRVTRRELMVGIGGATAGVAIGGVTGWVLHESRPATWPEPVALGDAEQLLAEIDQTSAPLVRPGQWSPKIAVIAWDPSLPRALDVYLEQDHGIIDDHSGLMTLSLRDPHCGCGVHWCASSQWFENPCHGEKYNRWGEWTGGPSPRGLDRYGSRVEDGQYVVNIGHLVFGPARDARVLDQEPAGRHCVG